MKKIDHIGIAVKAIEEMREFVKNVLGKDIESIKEVPMQKVKVGIITIGDVKIEFVEPLESSSPVARFIEKKGEGIHHIAIKTKNLKDRLQTLKREGIKLVDEEPRKGAEGKNVAFIYPFHGLLIELVEDNE